MPVFVKRLFRLVFGLLLYAVGIVTTIKADIGYAPWDVFHVGLSRTVGLSIGIASIAVGFLIVAIVALAKEKIGIGTVLNMLLIGVFMDLILLADVIPVFESPVLGFFEMIAGLFIIAVASFFYIGSGFGAGPRDSLMVYLTRKTHLPVGLIRACIEITVTLLGWLLGGKAGVGTVIAGFAIGFCVQITFRLLRFDPTVIRHETLSDTLYGRHHDRR